MRIQITDVDDRKDTRPPIVHFVSNAGQGSAQWPSRSHLPVCGYIYDVELDIDARIDLAKNAKATTSLRPGFLHIHDMLTLNAVVVDMEKDGMATLRIATDCLVMMASTQQFRSGDALEIRVPVSSVAITPFGNSLGARQA